MPAPSRSHAWQILSSDEEAQAPEQNGQHNSKMAMLIYMLFHADYLSDGLLI
jgi:hypothetical protein